MVKPYYQDEWTTIYHGDCRKILPSLAIVADLAIADPPYGETSLVWDRWPDGWPAAVLDSASVPSLFCFGSLRMFMGRTSEFEGWQMAQDGVWEKHNGSSSHADRFRRMHELWAHFYDARLPWAEVYKQPQYTFDATKRRVGRQRKPVHWGAIGEHPYASEEGGPRLMSSVIYCRSCHGYAENETQKPEGLLRPLIEYGCKPNGLVLDVFTGSGTALAVAKSTGRRSIGIEAREEQCRIAADRVSQLIAFPQSTP